MCEERSTVQIKMPTLKQKVRVQLSSVFLTKKKLKPTLKLKNKTNIDKRSVIEEEELQLGQTVRQN